ncbi:hypothetical protein ANCCEY_09256 [Ancylostoma ceylanicum]|uniref:Uncharacterized protein n=1 Tax=Ancylostoma ceylanicum TaxID=53326 RepID=A0A0D6LKJ1_9BILA|nr:hypothetical protein ANCCEY_09256 [Ancylostoma ceylanicum]
MSDVRSPRTDPPPTPDGDATDDHRIPQPSLVKNHQASKLVRYKLREFSSSFGAFTLHDEMMRLLENSELFWEARRCNGRQLLWNEPDWNLGKQSMTCHDLGSIATSPAGSINSCLSHLENLRGIARVRRTGRSQPPQLFFSRSEPSKAFVFCFVLTVSAPWKSPSVTFKLVSYLEVNLTRDPICPASALHQCQKIDGCLMVRELL